MVDNKRDLVDNFSFLIRDIQDINNAMNKPAERPRVVNVYDNLIMLGCK